MNKQQEAHLAANNGVQLIGKVKDDLSIKVLSSIDLGQGVGKFGSVGSILLMFPIPSFRSVRPTLLYYEKVYLRMFYRLQPSKRRSGSHSPLQAPLCERVGELRKGNVGEGTRRGKH